MEALRTYRALAESWCKYLHNRIDNSNDYGGVMIKLLKENIFRCLTQFLTEKNLNVIGSVKGMNY